MGGSSVVLLRRSFLIGAGLSAAGLALGVTLPRDAGAAPSSWPAVPEGGLRPGAFVHVAPDGTVTIVCHRSEMGQGVRSSLPVLIADELGADMARVKIVQGDGDKAYGDQNTDGSSSVRKQFADLRKAGAAARMMLVSAAAKRWNVDPASCDARDNNVTHKASRRTLGFGELAAEAATLPVPAGEQIKLRPRSELTHLGKELPLLDGPAIVTGKAAFGADVSVPGMLTAVIARPPVAGGKMVRHDDARALAVPGVKRVLELPAPQMPFKFQPLGGVAVLAENTWAALRGRAALDVTWNHGENAVYDSAPYRQSLIETVGRPGKTMRTKGDVDAALGRATKRVEALYTTPHLPHAPMEPPAALARVDGDRCEIWAPTQDPQTAREEVAKALGLDEAKVTVHVTMLGGAFGRKSKPDFIVEAALLAKAAGAPVRVQWTREDDLRHDYYHSTSAQRLEAGLDATGKVTAWQHRIAFPPIGSLFSGAKMGGEGELQQGVLDLPLAIENVRAEIGEARAHTRIGWMRSVANVYHAFAVQSFVDELAHERGKDPRENLLELLGAPRVVTPADLGVAKVPNYGQSLDEHPIDTGRLRRVIERVTELSRWGGRKAEGRSLGLAAHRSFLTYVSSVVSVVRAPDGLVRVDEAWIVADAGTIINLERVRSQLEGAVIFGLSLGLYGAITMKAGATEQSNFHDFRLMRIAEAPRTIHVDVIASEGPPGGVGEPGVPPVAPALANAVFALTGTRVRDLPIVRSMRV